MDVNIEAKFVYLPEYTNLIIHIFIQKFTEQ